VDMTHSPEWKPDHRNPKEPYETADIGMPEWGIRHFDQPQADDKSWKAVYRGVNGPTYPAFVLAALIMGQKQAWNHDALFDYTDRYVKIAAGKKGEAPPPFPAAMWDAYRKQFEPAKQNP
jgi:hypothetical protein